MGIAISEDHLELAGVADAFLERTGARGEARALLDAPEESLAGDVEGDGRPGLAGPAPPRGARRLRVRAGRARDRGRGAGRRHRSGTVPADGVGVGGRSPPAAARRSGPRCCPASPTARCPRRSGSTRRAGWCSARAWPSCSCSPAATTSSIAHRDEVTVTVPANTDATRRVGRVVCRRHTGRRPRARRRPPHRGRARSTARGRRGDGRRAQTCVTMASEYAKVREQFGRVIGMFQAVKHQAADMFVATQLADRGHVGRGAHRPRDPRVRAGGRDRGDAGAPGVRDVRGEEHPAARRHRLHVGARRARHPQARRRAGRGLRPDRRRRGRRHPAHRPRASSARTRSSCRRRPRRYRAEVREFITRYQSLPADQQLGAFLDSGYALAHWPKPWGRAAERGRAARDRRGARRRRRHSDPSTGSAAGSSRRSPSTPTSSRSSAGSDRASSTSTCGASCSASRARAPTPPASAPARTKVDGGWLVNGQKVWTSGAAYCNRGFATVRTDPDKPKHDGITMMVIDLHASGVDIRPLREASGGELFCEVFFDDVFVADEDVVGPVNGGWRVARSTLGNERVSIGGGSDIGDAQVRPARPGAPVRHRRRRRRLRRGPGRRAAAGGAPGDAAAQPPLGRARGRRRGARPRGQRGQAPVGRAHPARRRPRAASHRPGRRTRRRGPTPGCRRPRSSPAASPSPAARRRSCAARSVSACSACPATPCCGSEAHPGDGRPGLPTRSYVIYFLVDIHGARPRCPSVEGERVTGLLDGVRVVETGVLMTVDNLGRLLGDEGAEVVKVETPQLGDYLPRHHDPFRPGLVGIPPDAEPQQAQRHRRRPDDRRPRDHGTAHRACRRLHHRQRRHHQREARARLRDGATHPSRHRLLPGHGVRRDRAVRRDTDPRTDDGRPRRECAGTAPGWTRARRTGSGCPRARAAQRRGRGSHVRGLRCGCGARSPRTHRRGCLPRRLVRRRGARVQVDRCAPHPQPRTRRCQWPRPERARSLGEVPALRHRRRQVHPLLRHRTQILGPLLPSRRP